MEQSPSRAPLIVAIVLLLLPALYLGSYFALVTPRGTFVDDWDGFGGVAVFNYRFGAERAAILFCPLEQIDRKVRPRAWNEKARQQARIKKILEGPSP